MLVEHPQKVSPSWDLTCNLVPPISHSTSTSSYQPFWSVQDVLSSKTSPKPSPDPGPSRDTVRITRPIDNTHLDITFQRTIRVPDTLDTKLNTLPPSLGPFPLFNTAQFTHRLPADIVAKGGIFMPMYQREAMWINFSAERSFAVRIYVGGVNAVSGENVVEDEGMMVERRRAKFAWGESVQDYVVPPSQRWLDGIATAGGRVSQFVAMPVGSGYSVEAQVTGEDAVGGIQICVVPQRIRVLDGIEPGEAVVLVLRRYAYREGVSVAARGLMKVRDLVAAMVEDLDLHPASQLAGMAMRWKIIHQGRELVDEEQFRNLESFKQGSTLDVTEVSTAPLPHPPACTVFRGLMSDISDGGVPGPPFASKSTSRRSLASASPKAAPPPAAAAAAPAPAPVEMGIAAGGSIKQSIVRDPHAAETWDRERQLTFNLQILNAERFAAVTGLPAPATPVTAATYKEYGFPFFEMLGEEESDKIDSGEKVVVESGMGRDVGDGDGEWRGEEWTDFPVVQLGPRKSVPAFMPVGELEERLRSLKVDPSDA
ncbi:hypothetical protein MMC25_004329 [Agyrium rufum]|nr:hypothetical protein [Agyrium rufum]